MERLKRAINYKCVAIAAATGMALFLAFCVIAKPPKLVSVDGQYMSDLGTVPDQGVISHVFAIKNEGWMPLRITGVQSTCTCASARPVKSILYPGEITQLQVELRLDGKLGSFSGSVIVASNDPLSPEVLFSVVANKTQRLMVHPQIINFGTLDHGYALQRTVDIDVFSRFPEGLSASTLDIASPSPIHARLIEDAAQLKLRVSLDDNTPIGPLTGTVVVVQKYGKSEAADEERIEISVLGEVAGPVRADPSVVYIGSDDRSTEAVVHITAPSRNGGHRSQLLIENITGNLRDSITTSVVDTEESIAIQINKVGEHRSEREQKSSRGVMRVRCETDQGISHINIPINVVD